MQNASDCSTADFHTLFDQLLPAKPLADIVANYGPKKRRPPTLPCPGLLKGLVFHAAMDSGTLAANVNTVTGHDLSDAALAQRRQTIPWMTFEMMLEAALRPKADPRKHPAAFYQGLVLLGIDGSQFSVMNTPQNKASFIKAASRRMKAAFGKVGVSVLTELGLHNPVAAVVGGAGMSEQVLSAPPVGQTASQQPDLGGSGVRIGPVDNGHPSALCRGGSTLLVPGQIQLPFARGGSVARRQRLGGN